MLLHTLLNIDTCFINKTINMKPHPCLGEFTVFSESGWKSSENCQNTVISIHKINKIIHGCL